MNTSLDQNILLRAGDLSFTFLSSGDVYKIAHGSTMINQLLTNSVDGSLNNLYLRLYRPSGVSITPLLGVRSPGVIRQTDQQIIWEGFTAGVGYQVTFTLSRLGVWFWDVTLQGDDVEADIVYGQDIGIADTAAVRSNEAYLSQYIDHTVYHDEQRGYTVCSRQNQPQSQAFPYIQQGSLTRTVGYSTDGFQFFGLSYKETNEPEALRRDTLANEVYQYEFAYTALQSERVKLAGEARFTFYGLFQPSHPAAVTKLEYQDLVTKARDEVAAVLADASETSIPAHAASDLQAGRVAPAQTIGEPLRTLDLTDAEVNQLFPKRQEEERDGDTLLSFFTDSYEHVVLKSKELRVERPHGHILMGGHYSGGKEETITTTSYMYGVFNSQLVIGNTNFNKMITNVRNALNIPKTSGQRIYVGIQGKYRLLTMPSLFEIGFNYVRWYYKTADDTFIITNHTNADSPEVRLHMRSASGKAYPFLITQQMCMHVNEYELPFHMEREGDDLLFRADSASLSAEAYPDLLYRMHVEGAPLQHVSDAQALLQGGASPDASLVVLELGDSSEWTCIVQGWLHGRSTGKDRAHKELHASFEDERERYREYFAELMNGFHLTLGQQETSELFRVNAVAWWYTHNMLVHYSVPHGLEQYGGAAWGTRDVCQGPVEYFSAVQNFDEVRSILLTVFSHQYEDSGNWPQWFMFDNYTHVQQEESHGDIIVWPLKVLGDYLTATRDYSILGENVPYTHRHTFDYTKQTATLMEHALKEIEYIRENFLHDTYLSAYGDGDWDDTLQPANAQLKQYMASSWTVALTYQVIRNFAAVLEQAPANVVSEADKIAQDLHQMANGIRKDFNRYMLESGIIPGFVYMEEPGQPKLMLHPSDTETGIHYRLLPMTRSMISQLLTPEQALAHEQLIREQFLCPDGVRLMNRPAQYDGGVSSHFKRAEQAANFGREVGLQYVHAHIRFVEAMAKLGRKDDAWHSLKLINPVGIRATVPNAEWRQSNAYFSSSDGKFNTRYEAQERFGELREGAVPVKGGWRIYSSGPGIYMNQLISNVLGIRQSGEDLILDPVLPDDLDGLEFKFSFAGKPITFVYRMLQEHTSGEQGRAVLNGAPLESEPADDNRYRSGALRIKRETFEQALAEHNGVHRLEIIL
ncbi:cellobiose phosphorylase [Paenibacillus jamilae]|jgi:cellobiose phosphorylase|uniref:GH36-type glycosyl hydrolase domain-containing protein n=1 Tax=Paenibacillus TaxID=44249 RepID=UPI000D322B58|nr:MULTISPECIES: cellobiose phosphorylase [Paenibacillus]MDP9678477.1 cellobiose phosphorylase [Paenibacillus jamilae]KAF6583644.1 cellobiose phosphorylase [Paenibacillus sp. EKM211P]KAF6616036.1 cellobiose phosphorylase [Paenibacillus sp. EKM101P]KAF6621012.1 cellobiose phosphorylase [Paenibacillus sp. EKM102P]KAF6629547.1 cellobiose phosphorylase [Paenibacillus sp. EKM10P]